MLWLRIVVLHACVSHVVSQDCFQLDNRFCKYATSSRYRTIDGSCNNVYRDDSQRAMWGMSGLCYIYRMLDPDYADYWGRKAQDGSDLPNARDVSNLLSTQVVPNPSSTYSQMLMNWGQILGNEITYTGNFFRIYKIDDPTPCCKQVKSQPKFPGCREVPVSPADPFYSKFGFTCLNYVRSPECTNCAFTPRVQQNMRSVFIDAGTIYANIINDTFGLRTFTGGRLRMGPTNLLVDVGKSDPFDCGDRWKNYYPNEKNLSCFKTGDAYANNNAFKAAIVNVFARQHNRLASRLKTLNPVWNDEQLFQEARKIFGAQMEMITYNEWLPAFLGEEGMQKYHLNHLKSGYSVYNPNLNPSMSIEFSSVAMRAAGHSMISGRTFRSLFNGSKVPYDFSQFNYLPGFHDGYMDSYLRGVVTEPTESSDLMFDDVVRNNAEKVAKNGPKHGADILVADIMRGRDHGVASYKSFRKMCSNIDLNEFSDMSPLIPADVVDKLRLLYKNVADVDLVAGLLGETPADALLGPTNICIWGIQFFRMKYGDRYYFEHGGQTGSFSPAQLQAIRQTLLSKILCRNGDDYPHQKIQKHAMKLPSTQNPEVACSSIPDIDLSPWAGAPAQSVSAEGISGFRTLPASSPPLPVHLRK